MKKLSLAMLMLCVFFGVVKADIITVQVTAEITQFEDNGSYFDDSISVGTPLTMTYSYDTESEGTYSSSKMKYEQVSPNYINITAGNYQFANDGVFALYVKNDETDSFQVASALMGHSLPEFGVNMGLYTYDNTTLNSYLLEEINYNLADWTGGGIINILSGRNFELFSEINSITVVPEPASLLILGIGYIGMRKLNRQF